jgi:hypothetical protein
LQRLGVKLAKTGGIKNMNKIIEGFVKKDVVVETHIGNINGVLEAYSKSGHNGIGNLLLRNSEFKWILVRRWRMIIRLDAHG